MKKTISVLTILAMLLPSAYGISHPCFSAIRALFHKSIDEKDAKEFLKLQGDLTLHRLAWTYLISQKEDGTPELESVERTIRVLLTEKYNNKSDAFIKARIAFESQPLSRTTLAEIAPYLKEIVSQEYGETRKIYHLNMSDIKLLAALTSDEKSRAQNGKYEHRMFGKNSILNFVTLINSGFKGAKDSRGRLLNADMRLKGLEQTISDLQLTFNSFFKDMSVPQACKDTAYCVGPDKSLANLFNQNEEIQKIFWESIASKIEDDEIIREKLSLGEIWLKTKSLKPAPKPQIASKKPAPKEPVKVIEEKISIIKAPKPSAELIEGLVVSDPLLVVLKAGPGRNPEKWGNFDKKFISKMAAAILDEARAFEFQGKIYNTATGRSQTIKDALGTLPPERGTKYKQFIEKTHPSLRNSQVIAMVNGEKSFVHHGQLYSIEGKLLSAPEVIARQMSNKLGIPIKPERYVGMDQAYLSVRADALMNAKPYFEIGGKALDTYTGRTIDSPSRQMAKTKDTKLETKKRKLYSKLSDADLIANFHREARPMACENYAVIDKKTAEMKVYSKKGEELFSREVLLGTKTTDKRTVFTVYGEFLKQTNMATGAGVYTIGELKSGHEYYKKNFSNNLFSLNDTKGNELVLAIHQVPNGMKERYSYFGSSDPMDRRVSNGCINLKKEDFLELKKFMGPQCRVYILAEEEGNHFVLKNNQINFVSENKIPLSDVWKYNFNPTKAYHPISININNKEGDTAEARKFVKTLVDEKQKLMKIFNIDNDDYNDLALLAYGLMGNESEYGKNWRYHLKEAFPEQIPYVKSATQYKDIMVKIPPEFALGLLKSGAEENKNTSRGFTQIKFLPGGEWRNHYPEITKDKLGEPRISAIATVAYLVDAVHIVKKIAEENKLDPKKLSITRNNMMDYLAYIYMGRKNNLVTRENYADPDKNTYIQKLKVNMSYIDITQKIE